MEPAPEGERELGPRETSPALDTPAPHAADDPPPPPIDVDASQGTATQLAGLLDDEAGALNPLEPLPPAVESDDDPTPPAAGHADSPPGEVGPHESRLVALIADTAPEEANPCRALDVAVFLDSERLSAVGRRMRAAGQDTTPVPGPHSPEGDGLPPAPARGLYPEGPLLLPLQLGGRCNPGPTGGTSPRFCTRLPPLVEVGRKPPGAGGGGGIGGTGVQGGAMGGGAVGRVSWGGGPGGPIWGGGGGGHRLPLPPLALPLG